MSSQSIRTVIAIAAAAVPLAAATPADARSSASKKAARQLTKTIDRAHNRTVSTGKVRVNACKAIRRTRNDRRDFTCRVSVQLVYVDGSSRQCNDRTVKVRVGRKARAASFLNPARYVCGPLKPAATQPTDDPAPVTPEEPGDTTPTDDLPGDEPPAGNEPPATDAPLGPPTSLPPFFPGATAQAAAGKAPAGRAGNHARNATYYTWRGWHPYFQWSGYYWAWAEWQYTSLNCNLYDDYYALYWWNGYDWVYAGAEWYRHFIYGTGQYDWTQSPIC